jgi:hypothetical protein
MRLHTKDLSMMDEILRRGGGTYLSTTAAIPRAIPFLATSRSFEMLST